MSTKACKPPSKPCVPFKHDFNDSFETPFLAYTHLLPIINHLKTLPTLQPDNLTVYDPYYCQGSASHRISQCYSCICINENRDFYADLNGISWPDHDYVVTNPPYSEDHKARCLEAVREKLGTRYGYAVLMPEYVKEKSYYREGVAGGEGREWVDFSVKPEVSYDYDHFEGKGFQRSPFKSAWFCRVRAEDWAAVEGNYVGVEGVTILRGDERAKKRKGPKKR